MNDERPIGVMDSGIGGLTVLKALKAALPKESFIYVGDTARIPYGSRNEAVIEQFAGELAEFLIRQQVKAIMVACNTMSAVALDVIKSRSAVPVFNVVDPVVARLQSQPANDRVIGVLATNGTVRQHSYRRALKGCNVYEVACPLLVPAVEEGLTHGPVIEYLIEHYTAPLKKAHATDVVLGCTHYPILKSAFIKAFGRGVTIIDSAAPAAAQVKAAIKEGALGAADSGAAQTTFYFTDTPLRSQAAAEQFLGSALADLRPLNLRAIERVRKVAGLKVKDRMWPGAGRPVLILHGWGSAGDRWLEIGQRIHEAGHRVFALDLPGFGGSSEPPAAWDTAQYAKFLEQYVSSLGFAGTPFAMVGHSFGGQVALRFTAMFPQSVGKLVLIAAAGVRLAPPMKQRVIQGLAKVGRPLRAPLRVIGLETLALKLIGRFSGSYDYAMATPAMREVLKRVVREDLRSLMPGIRTPALLLWARDDITTPLKEGQMMARLLPHSRLVEFPDGGHRAYKQYGPETARLISDFIK